jgi:hypothetical protein
VVAIPPTVSAIIVVVVIRRRRRCHGRCLRHPSSSSS